MALSYFVKHEGIPLQILVDDLLGNAGTPLAAYVDNMQAIAAVQKGYSKKLKFLERTHRCSIGILREMVDRSDITISYSPTAEHHGDTFTKTMEPTKFLKATELMGITSKGLVGLKTSSGERNHTDTPASNEKKKLKMD